MEAILGAIESQKSSKEIVSKIKRYLAKHSSLNSDLIKNGMKILVCACQNGDLKLVKFLMKHRDYFYVEDVEDWEVEDGKSVSPLCAASAFGHIAIVRYLVKRSCNVNSAAHSPSALKMAAKNRHVAVVDFLIGKGADVDAGSEDGETALMEASGSRGVKCRSIIKSLIGAGADVNRRDKGGNTVLHYCVREGSCEILAFLVESGAKFFKNSQSQTPLLTAAMFGEDLIFEILIKNYLKVVEEAEASNDGAFEILPHEEVDALKVLGCAVIDLTQNWDQALCLWKTGRKQASLLFVFQIQENSVGSSSRTFELWFFQGV